MSHTVRGIPAFWRAVDAVADEALLRELYDLCFKLQAEGPEQPGAKLTKLRLPPVVLDGWLLDLPSERGFIGYGAWSQDDIVLVSLTMYELNDE